MHMYRAVYVYIHMYVSVFLANADKKIDLIPHLKMNLK